MSDKLLPEIISPEGLEVAEAYFTSGHDRKQTALILDMSIETVDSLLETREVKAYIDRVFFESGFRNREKIFGVMDVIIERKLEELEESGMGSSADILEIMKTFHKMKMDEYKMMIEFEKAKSNKPTHQTNIQNNIALPGSNDSNYMTLLESLSKKR
jgi:hypothetical protein